MSDKQNSRVRGFMSRWSRRLENPDYSFHLSSFPKQKLTEEEKIEEYGSVEDWAYWCVVGLGQANSIEQADRIKNLYTNFSISSGNFDQSLYDYAIMPYLKDLGTLPAKLHHMDITSTKLEVLKGEELSRPLDLFIVSLSSDTINRKLEKKKEAYDDYFMKQLLLELQQYPEFAELIADPKALENLSQFTDLSDIEKYFTYSYKELVEVYGNDVFKDLYEKLRLKAKFNQGFYNSLVAGEEIYYIGISHDEPVCRTVDPRVIIYDTSENVESFEDLSWIKEFRFMTPSQIFDEYSEYMTEEQINEIDDLRVNSGYSTARPYLNFEGGGNLLVEVAEWKSFKKVGVLYEIQDDGTFLQRFVDEYFNIKGWKQKTKEINGIAKPCFYSPDGSYIYWEWVQEVWEAINIDDRFVIKYGPKPNQHRSLNNPQICKLGYRGIKTKYPLIEKLKPVQILYNIIFYRLELAIAKAKGQVGIFDVAQLPMSQGIGIEKFLYYMDVMGIAFINSMEEGEGVRAGEQSRFNQYTSIDLSLANSIASYIGILDKLELLSETMTGITRQRMGAISQYDTKGGIQQSISQSSHVTESYFFLHKEALKSCINGLLEVSTLCWSEGKKGQYVLDDYGIKLFNIEPEVMMLGELSCYISDDYKYKKISDYIEQAGLMSAQTGEIEIVDVVKVLETSSMNEKKNILQLAKEAKKAELQQQAEQAQQNANIQQQILEAQIQMNKLDNQTKIQIAEIQANSRIKDDIQNSPQYLQTQLNLEYNKINTQKEIEKDKLKQEKELKKEALKLKEKEIEVKRIQANKKPYSK